MKKYLVTSSLIAILSVIPSLSSATPTDRQIVASKAYVDTKQNKIPVQTMTIGTGNTAFTAPLSLVSYPTTTDGAIGQLAVLDENAVTNYATANNINTNSLYEARDLLINTMTNVMPDSVPNSSLVGELFEVSKIPASGQYDIFGNNPYTNGNGTTNTDWLNANVKGTGVATRTGTNGVIGERKIFESTDVANYHATGLTQNQKDIQDISIPTMGAVMTAINAHTPATLSWTSTETTATQGYSTTFDDTTGNWPTADANKLVDTTALASALALKQNKIPAGTHGANNSVITYDATSGTTQERWILGAGSMLPHDTMVTFAGNALAGNNMNGLRGLLLPGGVAPTLEEVKNSVVPAEILGDVFGSKQNALGQKASNAHAQAITRSTYGYTESAYITAGGSVGLTTQSGAPAIINYVNGTVATDEDFTTFTTGTFGANSATNQNYIKNALVSLELLKDVYGELNTKITAAGTALPWTSDEIASATAYDATFTGDTGATADAWPAADKTLVVKGETFAKALATKQNKITTGLVVFEDGAVQGGTSGEDDLTVRALVATNAAGTTLTGNTIGILDANTIANSNEAGLALYGDSENYGSEMDNFVPTVRAVANALTDIWSNMPSSWTAFSWNNNTFPELIDAYNIDFGGNGNWPNTPNYLVPADTFVKGIARKQNIIPAKEQNSDFYSVLTDTSADGEVGKLQILTAGYMQANGESFASWVPNDNEIVTAGAIHRELLNNWQPIIPASMASNDIAHQTLSLPSFVVANVLTNGASPTLSSGTYGIITQDNIEDYAGLWSEFALLSNMDSAIPTVKAVANAITRLEWNSRIQDAIDSYRTQFFSSGDGVWWFSEYDKLINTSVFSKGLALKQNKLVAKASNARAQVVTRGSSTGNTSSAYITAGGAQALTTFSAPAIINYVNGTVATDEDFTTFTNSTFGTATGDALTTNKNYIKNALVSLELLKDVYAALHSEITSHVPSGRPNTVANYGANGALDSGIATYDGSGTYAPATDANKIATAAAVETKQDKMICAGYAPDHINDPDYCWLWRFAE